MQIDNAANKYRKTKMPICFPKAKNKLTFFILYPSYDFIHTLALFIHVFGHLPMAASKESDIRFLNVSWRKKNDAL